MPVNTNVTMTLVSYDIIPAPVYTPPAGQETGISVVCHFTAAQPGPGLGPNYDIILTSADLSTIAGGANQAARLTLLRNIAIDHLQKAYRPASQIDAVLAGLIGASVTV